MVEFLKKIGKEIWDGAGMIEEWIISLPKKALNIVKNMKKNNKGKGFKHLFYKYGLFCLSIFLVLAGIGALWFASIEIPDLSSFDNRVLSQSTKIFDRTGKVLLYDLSQNMRRTVIPFETISPNLKKATLAIEDSDFYDHSGIKISSIFRAILNNIANLGYSQGGSTITQQVVKNYLLTTEKTINRKIKEIFLSIKLERALTKDEIFSLYLNESPYGGTIYGVEEAAESFFGKSATDVTLAEAAYLAAIPQAPTHYSPYGKYRDDLEARKNLVLSRMKELGFISAEEYDGATAEKITFQDQVNRGIKAPHFVMFIKQYLEENYGEKLLSEGGLKVITTLDYDLQKKAEEVVSKYGAENAKNYNAKNAALVAMDPKTGEVLAMVGSRDYFDKEIDGNYNVATAKRQPGSSFKPFVYAEAFNKGYTPETTLFDVQTQFSSACGPDNFSDQNGCYAPDNYDGKFRGAISIRNALGGSINIPAVETLYLVGVQNAIDLATKMGISTLTNPDQYGLSLVLGGGEVTLLDMTSAYGVFANNGIKQKTASILKIEDRAGNTLEELEQEDGVEVLPKNTALTITDILSDNVARTPVFGPNSALYFPDRQVAAKTGTTNNYRDTWILGYTPQLVVGAWNGNNDNSPIDKRVAGTVVAPMWHAFMVEALKELPNETFEKPETSDLASLKPIMRGEWNTPGKGVHSILYYVNKENPLGPEPKNPNSDPQFSHWEYSTLKWAESQGLSGGKSDSSDFGGGGESVTFIRPDQGDFVGKNENLPVSIKNLSDSSIRKAEYYLNGTFIGGNNSTPYGISFIPAEKGAVDGQNELKVIVTDKKGGQGQGLVKFIVK